MVSGIRNFRIYCSKLTGSVALNKEEYLEQVPAVMVAAEGGDEEFYQRQIDELQWVMSNDIEDLYKTLGA
jgi:hypothetical protein